MTTLMGSFGFTCFVARGRQVPLSGLWVWGVIKSGLVSCSDPGFEHETSRGRVKRDALSPLVVMVWLTVDY